MARKYLVTFGIAAIAAIGCVGVFVLANPMQTSRLAAPANEEVHFVVPMPLGTIRTRLGDLFLPPYDASAVARARTRNVAQKYRRFRLIAVGHDLFPTDAALRDETANNVELAGYVALDAKHRADDLALRRDLDYFWSSDYRRVGKAVPFGCSFIIHLTARSADSTEIDLLEYEPTIKRGSRFGLGHNGPGFYDDYEKVAPTTSDRRELRDYVVAAVTAR